MNRSIWFAIVIAVALLAAVIWGPFLRQNGGDPKWKKEVYVAIVSSLTGDLAENGKDTSNGASLAFDEANETPHTKDRIIHYVMFDDQGDQKAAVSVANRVCQDPRFIAVIGHLTSGCMSAAAPVYDRAGIPVVMPVPTNPKITQMGYTSLFRIPPTDNDQAPFLAKYLLSVDPGAPVAVVHDLTAYGLGFAEAFRDTFKQNRGNIVAFDGALKESRDFRTLIAKLKALNPKYILLGATYDMGAPFARQMKELGLNATLVSGDGCYGSAFLEQAGDAAEGTIVSFIAPDQASSQETTEFFRKYEAKYGKVVSFAPLGYDAGKVVVNAIGEASQPTRAAVINVLKRRDFVVNGVTGKIEFADNGDNKNKNLVLYTVRQGKFTLFK
ncbi:branched-chain amino acid ABC transporter substrate-binding protein [Chlorobium sp. BLA1]|uniref:branched-chain amino acid ABC transporter substrate-binding protein n=1 Tax=Candidatus Chlorobium masyuteum TaxID=2716876 RepID=UPI00142096EF|nr:branched-chain amino acid ABC transporter substrate-binding protein [Candidatus Chlorobium masyuteum]NHQ59667.1 branched-chain amino acid ABC transporter substrate-binding protein [Candidatus Chlorobium masyuteum]